MSSEGGPEPPPPGGEPASVENYTDLLAHLLAEVRQINQLGQLQAAALRRTAERISTMEGRLQSLEHANSAALTQTALELNTLSALRETGRHAGLTIGALDVPEADLLAAAMMPPPPVPAAPHAAAPVASSDGAGPSAPPPRGEPGGVSQGVIHMGQASQSVSIPLASLIDGIEPHVGLSSKRARKDGVRPPEGVPARCRVREQQAGSSLEPPAPAAGPRGTAAAGEAAAAVAGPPPGGTSAKSELVRPAFSLRGPPEGAPLPDQAPEPSPSEPPPGPAAERAPAGPPE